MVYKLLIILPPIVEIIQKLFGNYLVTKIVNYITGGEKFYYTKYQFDNTLKKETEQLVILLPGKGCSWAKDTGGCTMCALYEKASEYGSRLTDKELIALFKIAVILTKSNKPEVLIIYNGGSFLNKREINYKVQYKIIKLISVHSTVKKVLIESRPEYIEDEIIKNFKSILNNKILQIGIGLESVNDYIRNSLINKGILIDVYKEKIKNLKDNGIQSLTYVLIKPIGISEKQAINEAIKTAKFVFNSGGDEVAFEASFVQPGTKMANLFETGLYQPPSLWSIIKILTECYKFGNVTLGNFEDEPPPIAIPTNCKKCTKKILEQLRNFRKTNDISHLETLPYCDCKKEWVEKINIAN